VATRSAAQAKKAIVTRKTYLRVATLLSGGGAAFSGFLSVSLMQSGVCAFNEPCPLFVGQPACYTGFLLFWVAFVISVLARFRNSESTWPMLANIAIAGVGVISAGQVSLEEVGRRAGHRLGLPTCAYGFLFFLSLLLVSIVAWRRLRVIRLI
jgi:hypothetical protein